jgi:hypothetical protein
VGEAAALVVWGIGCLVGAFALPISSGSRGWKTLFFLVAYFAVPVAVMAFLFRDVPKFSPRYLIVASPPLFLLPALGMAALFRRFGALSIARWVGGGLALAALVATTTLGLRNLYLAPAFSKSDFRTAARIVRERMAPGEVVLVVPGHTFPVWQYYFGPEGWQALPEDRILNVTHVLHYRNTAGQLNEWLTGAAGVWLVQWEPWVADPTDLVPHLLEQAGEEVPVSEELVGMRLRHYRLREGAFPLPLVPAVPSPAGSSLNLPLKLVGCDFPQQVRGDDDLQIGCYWKAQDALPHFLSVSARLVDAAGAEWGRADALISGSYLVAGRWPLDEPVLGRYVLHPFPGIPPGDFYRLELVVYEPRGTGYGTVVAGPIVVDRPTSPFEVTLPAGQALSGRLGGLVLEAASARPEQVLPGEEVTVEALWRVEGSFHEPHLAVDGSTDMVPLLPQPGATGVWQVGDRYRTISRVPISPHALGGQTALQAISRDGHVSVGTVRIDVTRTFTLPVEVPPVNYRLGDDISLVGVTFFPEHGDAGETVEAVLYWQAKSHVGQYYTVFVHMMGPDGQIYAQADAPPQAGRHPTTHWLPGEVVADPYQLERPTDSPPGEYRVLAGLYDLVTMDRLPVTGPDGGPVPDNAILIGTFEVRPQ